MTEVSQTEPIADDVASPRIVDLIGADRPEAFGLLPAMDAATLVGAPPTERLALLHQDAVRGLAIGLWECTAYETVMAPYPEHEFMYLLEGAVTIDEPDGRSTTVTAGESFVIPAGLVCSWKQSARVRKVFVTLAPMDPGAGPAVGAMSEGAVVVVDPLTALEPDPGPAPEVVVGPAPQVRSVVLFRDDATGFEVGLWECTGYQRRPVPSAVTEVMVPLSGIAHLGDGAGGGVELHPGAAVLVPRGAVTEWSATQTLHKIYCIV